jgi:glycosyltransferase involved in cell wall biosynthesis
MIKGIDHTFTVLAYKESPYLEECILSLKNQTVRSQIIITTSTPSDFLEFIAKKNNIKLIINEIKGGISEDWSFAYNCAETKYVTLAHQDDIYSPEYTEICFSFSNKYKDNLITFTQYKELYDSNNIVESNIKLNIKHLILSCFFPCKMSLKAIFLKKLMLSFGSPIPCPSVMYNKKNIGYFKFSKDFCINLDWDAWLRISKIRGTFIYIKRKLVYHRIHESSATSIGIQDGKRYFEDRLMFEKIWPHIIAQIILFFYKFSYKLNYV